MLTLTGNTGPYLQYATARIKSIFHRAGLNPDEVTGPIMPGEPAEHELALRLLGFEAAISQTTQTAEPHKLAAFVFEVASEFTTFYEQCPVIKAEDPAVRQSRLALASLTLRVLLDRPGSAGNPGTGAACRPAPDAGGAKPRNSIAIPREISGLPTECHSHAWQCRAMDDARSTGARTPTPGQRVFVAGDVVGGAGNCQADHHPRLAGAGTA